MASCCGGRNRKWDNVGEDVIVLHGFPRAKVITNISPFVMKLETYLRMADLKYEFEDTKAIGPKGRSPWITLNGADMGDSQMIIQMLSRQFNKTLNSGLSSEQKAMAHAIQIMCDEHCYLGLPWWRFLKDPHRTLLKLAPFPPIVKLLFPLIKISIGKRLKAQGIGLHSDEELVAIIRKDLAALSDYLGSKLYMMGDDPSEVDCSAFGVLAQYIYALPDSPFTVMIESDFRNLSDFCERMKERYWADWDSLLHKG